MGTFENALPTYDPRNLPGDDSIHHCDGDRLNRSVCPTCGELVSWWWDCMAATLTAEHCNRTWVAYNSNYTVEEVVDEVIADEF